MRLAPLALSCLLLAALALTGCHDAPAPAAAAPAAPVLQGQQLQFPAGHPQLAQLGVVAVEPAHERAVELPARLVWNEDRTQRIQPAFASRVERIAVDVGQAVRPGQLLAQLASPEFGAAQADVAKARADVVLAQKAVQRLRELFEAGVVARKELEQAEADASRAQAELQRAEARTRLYGGGAGVDQRLSLVAGMAGVVVERSINPGQEWRPDGGPGALFVISDPSSLWVLIDAREGELAALRPGAEFELVVPALPGERFRGRLVALGDAIDVGSRTVKARGVVDNGQRRLKAEMLASARFRLAPGAAAVIPASAVQLRAGGHWVMVQTAPGVFEPREIQVGQLGPREVTVLSGLRPGEQVVTEDALLLSRLYQQAQEARQAQQPAAPAAGGAVAPGLRP